MAVPAFQLLAERFLADAYAPETVAPQCGVDAATIRRIAAELADVAFKQEIRIAQRWTDAHGREHDEMIGRPVSMHAMRGISAHANGFHTCRMLHVLQMLLGAIDTPGSFRYQPPYPKAVPPANRPGKSRKANGTLDAAPLGYVHGPEDLLVDSAGAPRRIDKAFSWEHPLAAHGMLQSVIRNAWAGDPYRIDTLFLFMANMGWNSAMNTTQTRQMLRDRDPATGAYRIPHFIYVDAYWSETVNFADLVLPDTTYLERHDCISLLDRPISDADCASDAIRQPVCAPDADGSGRDVRPFQDVLIELGTRLGLPGLVYDDGAAKYPGGYAQYIVEHERAPGIGLLAGWRGRDGAHAGVGEANPRQLDVYKANNCYWHAPVPAAGLYYKMANRDYLQWAKSLGFVGSTDAIVLELYSETLQRFRLAAQGHGAHQPPDPERERVARYFDPLPFWYESLAGDQADEAGALLPSPILGEGLKRLFR
jgi:anaerobic selenocysteine-containing dehydrogenase